MAKFNRRGQCTVELALVAVVLTSVFIVLKSVWPAERRGFSETQLSRGRR